MNNNKGQDKREAIKQTALKLFCEEGFQQTSTARISREAGVATGTLFTYFKSKDDLINALFLESKQEMEESVISRVPEDYAHDAELIHNFWKESVMWSLDHLDKHRFIRLFKASSYHSKLDIEDLHKESAPRFNQVFQTILENMKTDLPNELVMNMFMNLYFALVEYLAENKTVNKRDRLIEECCKVFLKGIGYN